MDTLDPFQQRVHGFRSAFHSRSFQHEFGQGVHDVSVEREFREFRTGDGAVQIPARYLVKVAALFV